MTKIALVTGASRGIGAATALKLAQQGCDIAVNYLSQADAARAVVQQSESLGRKAIAVQADVSDYAQVQRMIETTVRELGGLHMLVNNAGYSSHGGIEQLSVDEWARMLDVTLNGAFYCAKLAVPSMRQAGWGRMINLCSLRAMTGSAHGPHYATAKAGLLGFTKSLALELAPDITVNAVAPGYTDTEMNQKSLAEKGEYICARFSPSMLQPAQRHQPQNDHHQNKPNTDQPAARKLSGTLCLLYRELYSLRVSHSQTFCLTAQPNGLGNLTLPAHHNAQIITRVDVGGLSVNRSTIGIFCMVELAGIEIDIAQTKIYLRFIYAVLQGFDEHINSSLILFGLAQRFALN